MSWARGGTWKCSFFNCYRTFTSRSSLASHEGQCEHRQFAGGRGSHARSFAQGTSGRVVARNVEARAPGFSSGDGARAPASGDDDKDRAEPGSEGYEELAGAGAGAGARRAEEDTADVDGAFGDAWSGVEERDRDTESAAGSVAEDVDDGREREGSSGDSDADDDTDGGDATAADDGFDGESGGDDGSVGGGDNNGDDDADDDDVDNVKYAGSDVHKRVEHVGVRPGTLATILPLRVLVNDLKDKLQSGRSGREVVANLWLALQRSPAHDRRVSMPTATEPLTATRTTTTPATQTTTTPALRMSDTLTSVLRTRGRGGA